MEKRRRMSAEARKRQIVETALELIAERGLRGTTMSQIAERIGIREASVYTHFKNRHAVLLAACDAVFERIDKSREISSPTENKLERLREMCDHHLELWATQGTSHHAHVYLEFIASATELDLRDYVREKELAAIVDLVRMIEEGKHQGTIGQHVDSEHVAWLIVGWATTGDVAHVLGADAFMKPAVSEKWLDVIFEQLTPPPSPDGAKEGRADLVVT